MAIEMANIFRSLNSMLESQERRQRFDVESSLAGMELSMKREQQRIGKQQWEDEQKEKKRQFNVSTGLAKEQLQMTKEDHFTKRIAQLAEVNQAETLNKEKQLWGTYFANVHDSYFTKVEDGLRQYTSTERKDLEKALKVATGSQSKARQRSGLLIRYGTDKDGAYMQELATIYNQATEMVDDGKGGRVVRNPKFIKGMMEMGMMPNTPLGFQNVRQDFNDLMTFHEIGDKLVQETFDMAKGDFKFEEGEYEGIAYDFSDKSRLTSEERNSFVNESLKNIEQQSLLESESDVSNQHMFGNEVNALMKSIEKSKSDLKKKENSLLNLSSELKKANLMLNRGMKLTDLQTSLLEDETAVRQQYQMEIASLNQSIARNTEEGKKLTQLGREESIKSAEYTPPGLFHFGIDALEKLNLQNRYGVEITDELFEEYTKSRKSKKSDYSIY